MKLIVGLGNPGRKYEQTRHNVGFVVAAKVASKVGASSPRVRFEGEFAEAVAGEKLLILCPHTYMNLSGKSVRKACDFFKLAPEDLLVICDDLNLTAGRIRLRASGSAGGQKGLTDIIRHLGTDTFPRLRIGIDRPPAGWETSDYVLGKFSGDEKDRIELATSDAAQAAIDWANEGIGFAMNRYNADPAQKNKPKKPKPKRDSPQADSPATNDTTSTSHGKTADVPCDKDPGPSG